MTDDKALELYEKCDRELPDRGDLGSFKRLIGAFARTLLAAPPAAALAPGAIPEWREPAANEHPLAKRWREDAENKYGDLVGVIQAIREYINVERDWNRPYNSEMSDRVTNADVETAEQLMLSRIRAEAAWFSSNAAPTPSTPAPSQVELDARVELEVKAGLWDEVRIICVPHGAGVDKPITEWLEERLAIHAPSTPAPVANTEEALQEIYEGWQDSEDGIWGLIFAVRDHSLAIASTKSDAIPATRPDDGLLWDALMTRNIQTSGESYLTLRCVGIPPTREEFVASIAADLLASTPAPKGNEPK